jgi:hypothetical protein
MKLLLKICSIFLLTSHVLTTIITFENGNVDFEIKDRNLSSINVNCNKVKFSIGLSGLAFDGGVFTERRTKNRKFNLSLTNTQTKKRCTLIANEQTNLLYLEVLIYHLGSNPGRLMATLRMVFSDKRIQYLEDFNNKLVLSQGPILSWSELYGDLVLFNVDEKSGFSVYDIGDLKLEETNEGKLMATVIGIEQSPRFEVEKDSAFFNKLKQIQRNSVTQPNTAEEAKNVPSTLVVNERMEKSLRKKKILKY